MSQRVSPAVNVASIEVLEPLILMSASSADVDVADLAVATEGDDLVVGIFAEAELQGASGDDVLVGAAGEHLISGGSGNDLLLAIRGDNVLDGGSGVDKALFLHGTRDDYLATDLGFGGIVEVAGERHHAESPGMVIEPDTPIQVVGSILILLISLANTRTRDSIITCYSTSLITLTYKHTVHLTFSNYIKQNIFYFQF